MARDDPETPSKSGSDARFPQTHWSVVLAAGQSTSPQARDALEKLCRTYWYPLYAFVRRRGHSHDEAADLVQGFFADLLEREWLSGVGADKGRFRTFLLCCLTYFLNKEWRKRNGPMRRPPGGLVALDMPDAEGRYAHEPVDQTTPDKLFERRWASTVVDQVLRALASEYAADGKTALFEKLLGQWSVRVEPGFYTGAARDLAMSEGAVKTALHRLRQRFGALLRREIEETVATPQEVDEEIRHLLAAYGRDSG